MARYYLTRGKSSEERAAEEATGIILVIATVGLVVVGSMLLQVFQQVVAVYAEHGQHPKLKQLTKAFAGAWIVACVLGLADAVGLAAWVGVGATVLYVPAVLILGQQLGAPPAHQPPVGELDSYLTSFDEAPSMTTSSSTATGTTSLRVIHSRPKTPAA